MPDFGITTGITQDFELPADISPSQITANQNDYNPSGLSTATILRLNSDASRNITGLQGGIDGRIIVIHNIGSFNIVFKNLDAGSAAGNQFRFGSDVTVAGDQSITIYYDSTTTKWRLMSNVTSPTGAPTTSQYVTLATDATLTNERVFTPGDGFVGTDGGAGGNYTFDGDILDRARKRVHFIEDFFGYIDLTSNVDGIFSQSVSGTGAQVTSVAVSETGVFGTWQLETGTTTTGRSALIAGDANSFSLGQGPCSIECLIKVPTLSTVSEEFFLRIGLIDSTSGSGTDGVFFEYDRLTSVNWRMRTRSNSVTTSSSTSTAVGTGWTRLKIVVNSGGTSVDFYIGGSNVGTIATNIPTGAGRELTCGMSIIKSAGTTTRTLKIDYYALDIDLTTPR